jgi:serine/threonine protein kinase
LHKRIAAGGMAELFLASDTRTDRRIVVKRILPFLAEEAEFLGMFLDEARIAASLHHPNIAEVLDLGSVAGSTFMVLELIDGVDLRRIELKEAARQTLVPPNIAAWLFVRLCEGLHHAHCRLDDRGQPLGIIHRDVSPQNVMVSFAGEVKLVDFGIARATAWVGRSKPGVIKGKLQYLAPEQIEEKTVDRRADIFALGTTLYQATTGTSPFARPTTETVMYAIQAEDPAPPTELLPGYPPMLSSIIMKCLRKDRTRRYQTAKEVAEALEAFLQSQPKVSRGDVIRYLGELFNAVEDRTYIEPEDSRPRDDESRTFEGPISNNPIETVVARGRSSDAQKKIGAQSAPSAPPVASRPVAMETQALPAPGPSTAQSAPSVVTEPVGDVARSLVPTADGPRRTLSTEMNDSGPRLIENSEVVSASGGDPTPIDNRNDGGQKPRRSGPDIEPPLAAHHTHHPQPAHQPQPAQQLHHARAPQGFVQTKAASPRRAARRPSEAPLEYTSSAVLRGRSRREVLRSVGFGVIFGLVALAGAITFLSKKTGPTERPAVRERVPIRFTGRNGIQVLDGVEELPKEHVTLWPSGASIVRYLCPGTALRSERERQRNVVLQAASTSPETVALYCPD